MVTPPLHAREPVAARLATPKLAQEQLRDADRCAPLAMFSHGIADDRRNAVEKVAELLRPSAPKSESEGQFVP